MPMSMEAPEIPQQDHKSAVASVRFYSFGLDEGAVSMEAAV